MDIASVMTKLKQYEGELVVTPNPITLAGSLTTKRAYLYIPEKSDAMPECDPIAFFNGYTLDDEQRMPNGQRKQTYTVNIQGLVKEPNLDHASQIASAFLAQLIAKLDSHVSLEGTCTEQKLRGAAPTLTRLEWGGLPFIGLNLFMTVYMRDSTTVGA
jgi:hypothetical protein